MLFLSKNESQAWENMSNQVVTQNQKPDEFNGELSKVLLPVFRLYTGIRFYLQGNDPLGLAWIGAGAFEESDQIMLNGFLASFLKRQGGKLRMPAVAFEDPAPYIHFTGVPAMVSARKNFMMDCPHSLPRFDRPVRIMDIGCGDGGMLVMLLNHLLKTGTIGELETVLLVDQSPNMIETAHRIISEAFPGVEVLTLIDRIENVSDSIDSHFDIAFASLSYHHMTLEKKRIHLEKLKNRIDHFVLFELDANNDTPDVNTPELALSVYQSYGRLIDFVFAHDAPLDVAFQCVDNFLMTELVSIMTQPRGVRTDYHMLHAQWLDLFTEKLEPEFSLLGNAICYSDESFTLFMIHYGRESI